MEKLYSWKVKRSGASMTVDHSCGRITGVLVIEPRAGKIVACTATKTFVLHT